MTGPRLMVLFLIAMLGMACTPAEPTATPTPTPAPTPQLLLTPAEVSQRIGEGGVVLLDVREPSEWRDDGHIEGAALIPLGELGDRVGELNPDDAIIVMCRSGSRSQTAAAFLEEQGFGNVTQLAGGIRSWVAADLPVLYGD